MAKKRSEIVAENIASMQEQGATEEEIQEYVDEVKSGQQAKPYGEPIVEDGQYQIGGDPSLGALGEMVAGPVEAVAAMASGFAGNIYGNMVGGVRYATDRESAPGRADEVAEDMTYQPKTQYGKDIMQTFAEKLQWLSDLREVPQEWGHQILEDVPEGETAGPIREAIARNVAGLPEYIDATLAATGLRAPAKTTPSGASVSSLKRNAKNLYRKVDSSGIQIKQEAFVPFRRHLINELSRKNVFSRDGKKLNFNYPKLGKPIRNLEKLKDPTIGELGMIQKNLEAAIKSKKAGDVFYANKIDSAISNFIKDMTPAAAKVDDLTPAAAAKVQSNVPVIGKTIELADDLWHRMEQAKTLETMYTKARRSSDVTKYGNWDEALSNKSRALLDSDARRLGMSDEVLTQLDDLVIGSTKRKLARTGAEMAPASSSARGAAPVGISAGLAAGSGFVASGGNPLIALLSAALPAAGGYIFKKLGNVMTKKDFAKIQDAILNKGQPVALKMIDELAQKYKISVATPAYSASTIDNETKR